MIRVKPDLLISYRVESLVVKDFSIFEVVFVIYKIDYKIND